ncbi:unnamed protein product [Candida verbasci]|uniref:Uncharacterized protein n=1 Tax=Candida verbasci TaxID=1227364 RepID=A0A9W4U0Q3_9ASCO|nr:unnamed protein product [Candida verbasci]
MVMLSTDVSYNKRLAQCICAIVWCLFSGGPIFGFAALKPILIKEHVYENLCDFNTSNVTSGSAKCSKQDLKLNMIFTVAAVLTNISALPIGRVLDVYGPKVCGLIGATFLYIASFTFIYSNQLEYYIDPYMIGYSCLALGGPFAFISSFQLSNSFPQKSGTILAVITGAFDASSALFLVYQLIYNKLGSFELREFFAIYLIVPTFITMTQLTIMPNESYTTSIEVNESTPLRRNSMGEAIRHTYDDENIVEHSGVFGILHGLTSKQQILTYWFLLICLFSTIQMLRINYFVATIGSQYQYIFNDTKIAESINKFFDLALPLGGIISIPFIGIFLDNCSTVLVLSGLLTISILIGVFGLFANFSIAILGVCLFVCYRPLFYTTISDVCAKVFGFETFGTVYGLIICFSGIINYGQSYLDELTHTYFKMNPIPINLILIGISLIIGLITVIYIDYQAKLYRK